MSRIQRISYGFIAATLALAGWLHLGTPLIAALFSYFALTRLDFLKGRGKWAAVGMFLVLLAALAYGLAYFINHLVVALPTIAEKAIPAIIQWAKENQVELPFADYDSLKELALTTAKSQAHNLGRFANFARGATAQFVLLVVGCVVAISLFLNPRFETGTGGGLRARNNLYTLCGEEIAKRFATLYESFATVMGAQIVISAINTLLTAIFVIAAQMPYAMVVVGVTFICGLLPVIGNLISNSIIVGIGFMMSPKMAFVALVFLIVVHKLEYFLNSKIIGERIKSPIWLTLLGLILGERLMGVPGMVLAPVILNYLKLEASKIRVEDPAPKPDVPELTDAAK